MTAIIYNETNTQCNCTYTLQLPEQPCNVRDRCFQISMKWLSGFPTQYLVESKNCSKHDTLETLSRIVGKSLSK